MQHFNRIQKLVRILSLGLVFFVLAAIHTETISPRVSASTEFQRITPERYNTESPQTQRRAINSQLHEYGASDKKYKRTKLDADEVRAKITIPCLYRSPDKCPLAARWYFVITRHGTIHSILYA